MHLIPECSAMCAEAIIGIKQLGKNVKILCNKFVENIERDNFILGISLPIVSEKLSTLDVGDKLINIEK